MPKAANDGSGDGDGNDDVGDSDDGDGQGQCDAMRRGEDVCQPLI